MGGCDLRHPQGPAETVPLPDDGRRGARTRCMVSRYYTPANLGCMHLRFVSKKMKAKILYGAIPSKILR